MREPQAIAELLRRRVRLVARVGSVGLVCGLNGLIQPHPGGPAAVGRPSRNAVRERNKSILNKCCTFSY
jgi:hypothetical protein